MPVRVAVPPFLKFSPVRLLVTQFLLSDRGDARHFYSALLEVSSLPLIWEIWTEFQSPSIGVHLRAVVGI